MDAFPFGDPPNYTKKYLNIFFGIVNCKYLNIFFGIVNCPITPIDTNCPIAPKIVNNVDNVNIQFFMDAVPFGDPPNCDDY